MSVRITSFGYGHGPAPEADLTVDVRRNLRNPHADPGMRQLTGLDPQVAEHVHTTPGARVIVHNLTWTAHDMDIELGQATIAIGCAGGRHRSVTLTEALATALRARNVTVAVEHRDIDKPLLPPAVHAGGAR